MPMLVLTHPFEGAVFAVWQITESASFFENDLQLSIQEQDDYGHYSGNRKIEWLASRWLLHHISGQKKRMPTSKDGYSKPFFPNNTDYCCSLSHSNGIVSALLVHNTGVMSEASIIGCDIQVLVPKIKNIAFKFINETEFALIESLSEDEYFDLLHILWTSKESMYKAYGMKSLDFKKNMHLSSFTWNGQQGEAVGKVMKDDYMKNFNLQFEKVQIPNSESPLIWTVTHATTTIC